MTYGAQVLTDEYILAREDNHRIISGRGLRVTSQLENYSGVPISWNTHSPLAMVAPPVQDQRNLSNIYLVSSVTLSKAGVEMQMSELKQIVAENSRGADWAKIVLEHYALCYDPNNGMNTNWKPEFDITFIEVIDVSKLRNDVVYYHPRSNITFKLGVDSNLLPYHLDRAEYFESYQNATSAHLREGYGFQFVVNDLDVDKVNFKHLWLCSFKKPVRISINRCRYQKTGLYIDFNGEHYDYLTLDEVKEKIGTVFSVDENGYVSYQTENYLQKEKDRRKERKEKRNKELEEKEYKRKQKRQRKENQLKREKLDISHTANQYATALGIFSAIGLMIKFIVK